LNSCHPTRQLTSPAKARGPKRPPKVFFFMEETKISDSFIKFQRGLIGRGPEEARTFIIEDMVLIRLRGVLTVEEAHLAKSEKGRKVVKEMRKILRETFRVESESLISQVTGCNVISSHSDISTKTGERVEIFILDANLEKKLH
jgi:uncharacterized protein YbcI